MKIYHDDGWTYTTNSSYKEGSLYTFVLRDLDVTLHAVEHDPNFINPNFCVLLHVKYSRVQRVYTYKEAKRILKIEQL